MVNESKTQLLEDLGRLGDDGQPWHAIARRIRDWSEPLPNPVHRRREIWEPAAEKVKVSAVMLKRYYTVFTDIEEIAEANGLDLAETLPASFSGAELAVRLYARNREEGLAALVGLRTRSISIASMREKLERNASLSARQIAKAREGQTIQLCEDALAKAASSVFGEGAVTGRRPKLRHFHPVGFEIRDAASTLLAGGDLYLLHAAAGSDPIQMIGLSALMSLYMPKYWLMFGPGIGSEVVERAMMIVPILAPRMGILRVAPEEGVKVVRPAEPNEQGARRGAEYRTLVETLSMRGLDKWKPPSLSSAS